MVDAKDLSDQQKIIDDVVQELEVFWMSDEEDAGEAIFNKFAAKYHDKFDGNYDTPDDNDNKLEYTTIHKEYQ